MRIREELWPLRHVGIPIPWSQHPHVPVTDSVDFARITDQSWQDWLEQGPWRMLRMDA